MYTIEQDIPYQTSYAKCKNPELRAAAHQMKVGDSILVNTLEECALLQAYIDRMPRPEGKDYTAQRSRRKQQCGADGNLVGYRVWRLA